MSDQNDNEYKDFLRKFIYALDKGTMPPVSDIPIDELELLEVIVPDILTRMERDDPIFETDRAKKVKRNLLAWWDEKPRPMGVTKDFYCSQCFLQHYKIPCKPEDGAIMGYCPKCNKRQTLIHGNYRKVFTKAQREGHQS